MKKIWRYEHSTCSGFTIYKKITISIEKKIYMVKLEYGHVDEDDYPFGEMGD